MTYTAKDIRTLHPMDQIRLSPGMWIGSTEDPHHLVEEALDNALDEAQGGHVSIIAVILDTKTGRCAVLDNGRGIPISDNTPEKISTELFSGAKFQDKKTAYEIASGLHGVGLVAVNALSDQYQVEVYRNKQHAIFEFENGNLHTKTIKEFDGERPFSTRISFLPTKKKFENLIPNIDRIRRRLSTASAEMPKVTFVLTVDNKKEVFKVSLLEHFANHCLLPKEEHVGIMKFNSIQRPEAFKIMMTYSATGGLSPRVLSSINLLPVDGGGTHVNWLYELIREFFISRAKKGGFVFQPQDCLVGLRAYLMLSLKEPKFSGQTKDKLTNTKAELSKLADQLRVQIETYFTKHPAKLEELLQRFDDYRSRLDAKKIKGLSNGKRAATKFTKLRDCTSKLGELFIVEGDSAGGGFVDCRDPKKHAILPLRGKIPSAANAKNILQNKEVGELIQSLGTGVGPDFNLKNLKYSKIICATDADEDGYHIFCLVTLVLAVLVPEVIKAGKYFFVQTPLWAINEKKAFIPLWKDEDVTKAKEKNRRLTRLKGLGELNPDQLKVVAISSGRKLIPITFTKDMDKMIKLFSDAGEKRNLLQGGWEI